MENPNVLKEWFHRVDSNNTGSINASQLKNALAIGNLDFPLSVVRQMIRMYDFDRNGTMDFKEFVALNKFLLKEYLFEDCLKDGKIIFKCLCIQILAARFCHVQNAFSQLDRGNGFLTPEDVYQALVKLGFPLDSPAFFTVCESFDQNKMGIVRLDAFISLCIFVQSARNLFNSFDTTKQGRVTLDFNQFVYCTANCRM